MSDTLARIDWKMGQTLLPEHFVAQEDALMADATARFGLLGAPFYGIGRLKWNDSLLAEGIVSITTLSVVLPTGQLVHIPGNARAQAFNMNVAGTTKVTVYFHLTKERVAPDGDNDKADNEGEPIERVVRRVALSSEQTHKNAVFTMKLADFEKDIEGAWSLIDAFVPPILQVGTSPFLAKQIDLLSKAIQVFQLKVQEDVAAKYLGGEGLFGAKTVLKAVYKIQRFLANVRGQVHVHPYQYYEALKDFYSEVCVYQEVSPADIAAPYLHEDLAGCLKKVVKPLFEQLQVTKGKTPYLSFERGDGVFQIKAIPQEVRVAKEVYVLVQKPKVSDVVAMDGVKIASRARLPVVHQLSLVGIPAKRIERPPFQHQFGAEVEFYQLAMGEEWDQALREGSLAFFDAPHLAKVKAYVYWRSV